MYRANVDLQKELNPEQHKAVLHQNGPILVLAGAGSGKTRVITYRIANLIASDVRPNHILAVTFTNKAAQEMRSRAESILGQQSIGLWIGTFHSICAKLLRMYGDSVGLSRNYVIYDDDDQLALLRKVFSDLNISDRMMSPKDVRWQIDRAKNDGIGPEEYSRDDFLGEQVAKIYSEYERRLLTADAVDFGGLLHKTVLLLKKDTALAQGLADRFRHVLVDEFQDTNAVQYELVKLLATVHRNLCVVGDDDQSIYSWRGADIRNILGFERDFSDALVVKLEQNYRSTQVILDAAAAIIERNTSRKAKRLWTDRQGGEQITCRRCQDDRDEARFVVNTIQAHHLNGDRPYSDFAIFYRTHAQSRVLEETLRSAHPPIPYIIVGGIRFYERAEIKDLLAYLRIIANTGDEVSLLRVINVPTRGIGDNTIEKVSTFARTNQMPLWEAIKFAARQADAEEPILRSGPRRKLKSFVDILEKLKGAATGVLPSELAEQVLEETGYLERLAIDGSPEAQTRAENLMELVASLRDFEHRAEDPSLVSFLEQMALASDLDTYNEGDGQVTLMTVHSAKGLEYPEVFIVGLEQGIFPHSRSLHDSAQMEEERRLAYVAVTRARERLTLTYTQSRWVYAQPQTNPPSEFLKNIPVGLFTASSHHPNRSTKSRRSITLHGANSHPAAKHKRISPDEVWIDRSDDQSVSDFDTEGASGYHVGMSVRHAKFGVGKIRVITGTPPNVNLTIYFPHVGAKTIRSQFVQPA